MHDALIAHEQTTSARQLVLLFHGVGSSPDDLLPLGQAVGHRFPDALVLSVRSPDASDLGNGWQWFSVRGIDEANRPMRVAEAMPRFLATVQHWQHESGLDAATTTLIGFSQGAIMALEATQRSQPLAARVIAIAGRFAQPPRFTPPATALHLLHGEEDHVVPQCTECRRRSAASSARRDSHIGRVSAAWSRHRRPRVRTHHPADERSGHLVTSVPGPGDDSMRDYAFA